MDSLGSSIEPGPPNDLRAKLCHFGANSIKRLRMERKIPLDRLADEESYPRCNGHRKCAPEGHANGGPRDPRAAHPCPDRAQNC